MGEYLLFQGLKLMSHVVIEGQGVEERGEARTKLWSRKGVRREAVRMTYRLPGYYIKAWLASRFTRCAGSDVLSSLARVCALQRVSQIAQRTYRDYYASPRSFSGN